MQYTERSYKPQAIAISVAFHGALLLLFFFFILRTPDPPLAQMGGSGIELNYGTSDEGSGDLQTMNTPNPSEENVESAPSEETPTQEENPSEVTPVEETEKQVITGNEESPVVVKKEEVKKTTPVVAVDKTEKKKTETTTTATNTDKNVTNGKTGTEKTTGGNNNGDKNGKIGDQGSTKGSLDAKALYGNEGNGGNGPGGVGGNLDMAGWMWDTKPDVKDKSDESGRVVIGIKVDSEGNIVKVWKIESNLSPSVYKYYEDEVSKLSFSKTGGSSNAAAFSEGKVTFIKKSK